MPSACLDVFDASPGRLVAEVEEWDFGLITSGAPAVAQFTLRAEGDSDVVVESVKQTCGCTDARMFVRVADGQLEEVEWNRAYPPGTTFELEAALNTEGRSGAQRERVFVVAQGADEMSEFVLRAVAEPLLAFDPPAIKVRGASAQFGGRGSSRVVARTGGIFSLTLDPNGSPEHCNVSLIPIRKTASGQASLWRVDVELAPGVAPGNFSAQLGLEARLGSEIAKGGASEPAYRCKLLVLGQVEGVMELTPAQVDFGGVQSEEPSHRVLTLRNPDPGFHCRTPSVEVLDIDAKPNVELASRIRVGSLAQSSDQVWEIGLEARAAAVDGPFYGILRIRTGHPLEPAVDVYLKGVSKHDSAR